MIFTIRGKGRTPLFFSFFLIGLFFCFVLFCFVYFSLDPPQEYLAAAVDYLNEDDSRIPVDDVKGIWVASDDYTMADEVSALAHTYFPNVDSNAIVWVAGGVPGGAETSGVFTHTNQQVLSSRRRSQYPPLNFVRPCTIRVSIHSPKLCLPGLSSYSGFLRPCIVS